LISSIVLSFHPGSSPVVYFLFRFGQTLCPVCMGDPQDPLCLPCKHIFCVACIKQWLNPGQMYCPLCMQPVDDDFPMFPSNDIRLVIVSVKISF
uniref:RING-type domain-containing protein n=1 Tax=Seriola dumerili TaxID=41447 RepID=A0A3B4UBJ7_SERDU